MEQVAKVYVETLIPLPAQASQRHENDDVRCAGSALGMRCYRSSLDTTRICCRNVRTLTIGRKMYAFV